MANAGIDQNSRQTLTAKSSLNDGSIVDLWADPTTHRLLVDAIGAGITIVTTATTPDDTTTVYVFTSAPTVVVVNGATYRNGSSAMGGTISISGTTVTLPSPVGTGGDIYGMK